MITVGVTVGLFVYWYVDYGIDSEGILLSIVGGLLTFIVSALTVLCISAAMCDSGLEYEITATTETELIALQDEMAIGGGYVYRGYINEELKYTYLYKVPDKGITSGQVNADSCYINYISENEKPKLVKKYYHVKNPFVDFITFDSIVDKVEYSLCVPSGSIIAEGEYEIDLE
jgi:hypothetical protein